MTEGLVVAWLALVTVVGVNAAAAGGIAFLHGRRKSLRRGMRALLASTFAGFLPASTIVAFGIVGASEDGTSEAPAMVVAIFVICQGVATLVALPGALIAARGLEAPGDEFRTFE